MSEACFFEVRRVLQECSKIYQHGFFSWLVATEQVYKLTSAANVLDSAVLSESLTTTRKATRLYWSVYMELTMAFLDSGASNVSTADKSTHSETESL